VARRCASLPVACCKGSHKSSGLVLFARWQLAADDLGAVQPESVECMSLEDSRGARTRAVRRSD